MKRKLFKQIRAEWHSNIWLLLELLIASVATWYIADFFYVNITINNQPKPHEIDHCYLLTFNDVTDKSVAFIPDRSENEIENDVFELLNRLDKLPFVEAVSLSHVSIPYDWQCVSGSVCHDTIQDLSYIKMATPGFFKVFDIHGQNGETPDQLDEKLENGEIILSGNPFRKGRLDPDTLVGKNLCLWSDTTISYRVAAQIFPFKPSDFNEGRSSVILKLPLENYAWASEYCIRVNPDKDKDIERQLMQMSESLFHVGNKLLVNVTSFGTIRDRNQQADVNKIRDMSLVLGFLLFNIFLGLFGTFWYRTGQRTSEIAIRLSMGAKRSDIFRRLVSEGLMLLVIVTPIAIAIDCLLAYNELNTYFSEGYLTVRRMAISCGITFAAIALMIVAGVWIPASRAQRIAPAIALKDE